MFDFLKPKTEIRPEELGIVFADTLASIWFKKIAEHVSGYSKFDDVAEITKSELQTLWRLFLMVHCTVISVGVESTHIDEDNKRIVLDAFWNSVADCLREQVSEAEAVAFQKNTAEWYPKLKELMVEPSVRFTTGGLGPGKALLKLALPHRDLGENVPFAVRLTVDFVSVYVALTELAVEAVKRSKFKKSLIRHE